MVDMQRHVKLCVDELGSVPGFTFIRTNKAGRMLTRTGCGWHGGVDWFEFSKSIGTVALRLCDGRPPSLAGKQSFKGGLFRYCAILLDCMREAQIEASENVRQGVFTLNI